MWHNWKSKLKHLTPTLHSEMHKKLNICERDSGWLEFVWVWFPGSWWTRNDNLTVNQFAAVPVPLTSVIGHKVAELIECDSDGFQLGKCHREVPSFNFDWLEVCAVRVGSSPQFNHSTNCQSSSGYPITFGLNANCLWSLPTFGCCITNWGESLRLFGKFTMTIGTINSLNLQISQRLSLILDLQLPSH